MTQPEPPAPSRWQEVPRAPTLVSDLGRALPVAVRRGLIASLAAIVLGQLPALAVNLGGGGFAIATQLRMGWLYTVAANAASIRIEQLSESTGEPVLYGVANLRLAMLTFTAIMVWMLVRAGGASARRVIDRPVRRALAGALVAFAYAAPLVVLALSVELGLDSGGGFFPDVTTVAAVPRDMLVLPFSIGAVAGALGGLHTSTWWSEWTGRMLAAGWRTFATALFASLLGLLAFAASRPAGLDGYVQELRSFDTRTGALVGGHQILLLPNQATLVLVPAMGACDTVTIDGTTSDVLCLDRLPDERNPLDWLSATLDERSGAPTEPAPWSAKIVVLAPLIAVVVGSRSVVRERSGLGRAAAAALGAALVFAILVTGIVWASTVELTWVEVGEGAAAQGGRNVALGAGPLVAGAYALGWGVVIGVPTACATALVRRRRAEAG